MRRVVHSVLGRVCAGDCLPEIPGDLPKRPPNLCAGCPHRATYYAVREVFGDNAVYSSDIGCYSLGILPPFSAADFLLCMYQAARDLRESYRVVNYKVKKHGIDPKRFTPGRRG